MTSQIAEYSTIRETMIKVSKAVISSVKHTSKNFPLSLNIVDTGTSLNKNLVKVRDKCPQL